MPSQYVQAKHCQLFRTDLEDLLLLPTRIILCGNDVSKGSDTEKEDSRIAFPTLGGALSGLLSEVHARASIENTIVRVFIPKSKQEALLLDNPYVQLYQQQSKDKLENKKEETSAMLESNVPIQSQRPSHKEMLHRVGRVVALLPKPKSTNQGINSGSMTPGEELLSSWLLAVHIGEMIELFPIKCVSNEALSESEHIVYLHSTLGKYATARPTTKPAATNVTDNFILTGERVEAVKKNLKDLRAVLEAVQLHQQQRNGEKGGEPLRQLLSYMGVDTGAGSSLHRVPPLKRARTDGVLGMAFEAAKAHGDQDVTHQTDEEVEAEQARYFGNGEFSEAVRFSRLTHENKQLTEQLDQLRQMLQGRDDSLALLHKQMRQTEEQHKSELSQWCLKELDASKTHERIVLEYHTKLNENETLLQKADAKLRELAKMTVKYKSIFDEVLKRMNIKGRNPEEVLALLKDDKFQTPF
ncbi:unnamed protein product [Phytomonas sp. Hart1]|nr:unnamed protein product [Phytomonas sp. Hart1]|eukprot:CCW69534.1 unnamed protein product [Phytomonas sp. isolate Hart1]